MQRVTQAAILAAVFAAMNGGQVLAQPRPQDRSQPPHFHDHSPNPANPHGGDSQFGSRAHVDRLAAELFQQANAICWEMYRHYQQNPGYSRAYRDMYSIKEGAKRIDAMVRQNGRRQSSMDERVSRELQDLDHRFHDFETDIRRWRPDSRYQPKTELNILMTQCEESLHHLMSDYGVDSVVHRDISRNNEPVRGRFPRQN